MADKQYVSKFIGENDEEYWVRDAEAIHPQFTLLQYKQSVTVSDATSAIAVDMGSSYTYLATDVVDVYLNGLRLTASEYSVTGTDSTINVTLTATSFTGQMEVVVTKLAEEV